MPNEVKPLAERITRPNEGLYDNRGSILNLVFHDWRDSSLLGAIGGVELIHSRSGVLRANHKHTSDWHYLYVVYGKVHYEEFGDRDEGQTLEKGEMVYTPPGVWHRVWSPTESLMICISHLPRDKATHETDVVRP